MEVGRVNVKITADNSDANSKFKETKQNLSDIKTPLAGIENLMKSAFAVATVAAFTTAVKDSLNVMAQYETAMKGLQKTSEGYGQSALKAMQYAQRLSEDGLITVIDSATTLKNLMGSGFNIEEAFNLATAMKDIGAFNNTVGNIGQAMQDASKGIKTNSIELIENIGLTQRLSGVMDKAGISIANGIDLSNNAAQRQALLNSVLEEGKRNYGNAAEYANTYAGSVAKMQKSFKDLQNEMATLIAGPAGKLLEVLAGGMKEITVLVKQVKGTDDPKAIEQTERLWLQQRADELRKKQGLLEFYKLDYDIAKANNLKISDEKVKYLADYYSKLREYNTRAAAYLNQNQSQNVLFGFKPSNLGQKLSFESEASLNEKLTNDLLSQSDAIDKVTKSSIDEKNAKSEMNKVMQENLTYWNNLNAKIDDQEKRMRNLGATSEEIDKMKSSYLQNETKGIDSTSAKYKVLINMIKSLDNGGDKRYFSELETEIKNVEIVGKVLDKTIDEINQSKLSVISGEIEALGKAGDTTSDRFEKLRAMWNALVKEMNNSKIAVRIDSSAQYIHPASNVYNAIPNDYTPDEYNPYQNVDFSDIKLSGAGSSGVNMGAYYGGLGYNGMISNAKNTRKSISTGEGSGAVYNEKQSEYYKKLYSDMADELNKATESVGSAFSDLGDKLNNDFLKSLGSTVSGISDLQQSLEAMKNAKSIGGTAGTLGTLSAGLGIASAVIGIGTTIYNAMNPVSEKQMSAAEKMNQAVQAFKDSIKNSTVQEIGNKSKDFSKAISNLEYARKSIDEFAKELGYNKEWKNTATIDQKDITGKTVSYDGIDGAIAGFKAALEAIKPEIVDKLNIAWTDLAGSVRGAFNASNLTDFYSQFKSNLQSSIKDALVSAFLQSEAMKNAMSGLTDSIYNGLSAVGFDASKISPETMNEWNTTIDNLSKQGGAFFGVLQKLGLAGTSAADALNSVSNSMKNMPEGIKVAAYRFAATSTAALISKTPLNPIKPDSGKPFVGAIGGTPNTNIEININGTQLSPIQLKTAVLEAIDSSQMARFG